MPKTLLITGTVGVGKTTTANAISTLLRRRNTPHALIDLDALRTAYPSPPSDPFNETLGLANLTAVSRNYRAAGAEVLVIATVVETKAMVGEVAKASGVGDADMVVVRLVAREEVVQERIGRRYWGANEGEGEEAEEEWHRQRAKELERVMEEAGLPGVVLDAGGPVVDVAARALMELEEF